MSKYHRNFAPEGYKPYAGPAKPMRPAYRCTMCGEVVSKDEYGRNKGDCGECRSARVELRRAFDMPQPKEMPRIVRDVAVQLRRKAVYPRW